MLLNGIDDWYEATDFGPTEKPCDWLWRTYGEEHSFDEFMEGLEVLEERLPTHYLEIRVKTAEDREEEEEDERRKRELDEERAEEERAEEEEKKEEKKRAKTTTSCARAAYTLDEGEGWVIAYPPKKGKTDKFEKNGDDVKVWMWDGNEVSSAWVHKKSIFTRFLKPMSQAQAIAEAKELQKEFDDPECLIEDGPSANQDWKLSFYDPEQKRWYDRRLMSKSTFVDYATGRRKTPC